jgi:ABC-type amino acid transport substrate-binding protein
MARSAAPTPLTRRLGLALALAAGLLGGAALAAPPPPLGPGPGAAPPLRAVLFDIAPYAQRRADGAIVGAHAERVNALARRLGRSVHIHVVPFARVPFVLEAGEADLTLGFATPALREHALSLGPVAEEDTLLIAARGRAVGPGTDLSGWLVGRARGGCTDLDEAARGRPRWFEVNHFPSGLRMLERGRLDGLCLTRTALNHAALETGLPATAWGGEWVVGRRSIELWVRRGLPPPWVDALRDALAAKP